MGVTQVKFGHCSRVVTVAQLLLLVEDLLVGYVVGRKCVRIDLILLVLLFTVFNLSSGAGQPASYKLSSTISHYLFV